MVGVRWPRDFLNYKLAMWAGMKRPKPGEKPKAFYNDRHVKVMGFKDSVKWLKGGDDSSILTIVFRKDLGTTVEEQLSDIEVPNCSYTVKCKIAMKQGT